MALKLGDEFRAAGTPSQDLLRRLLYYASIDSGSVVTGGFKGPAGTGSERESAKRAEVDSAWLQLSEMHQARIAVLQDRLDELDRISLLALRDAEERLEDIKRNANRTIDGRLAFEAEDGTIRDEQGNEIGRDEIDETTWKPDAPTYEGFDRALKRKQQAEQFREKVQEYRERLDSGDLTEEDLDDLDEQIGALESTLPGFAASEEAMTPSGRSISAASDYDTDTDAGRPEGPTIQSSFAGAARPTEPGPAPESDPDFTSRPGPDFTPV